MASLREHRDKSGKLTSYYIRVYRGRDAAGKQLKPYTKVFSVPASWSESTARKKAEAVAAVYEAECLAGQVTDSRQTFEQYAEYVLKLKEAEGIIKHSTLYRYRELAVRVNKEIGHIKLKELKVQHLNIFYIKLQKDGDEITLATAKPKLIKVIDEKTLGPTAASEIVDAVRAGRKIGLDLLAKAAGIAASTVGQIKSGQNVRHEKAEAVAKALGYSVTDLFAVTKRTTGLSPKTVLEHHRFISSVLAVAVSEGILPDNIARRASPPRSEEPEVNYLQPDDVKKVIDAINEESIWWKTIAYLIIFTGARRGEILGLREEDIDFDRGQIHIFGNLQYAPDIGIYWETPKTKKSKRFVSIPTSLLDLIKEYLSFKNGTGIKATGKWADIGLLFVNPFGKPFNPDAVTDWFSKLENRYDLPHLNPHAFRHSMASVLIYNNVDIVSVSRRLGHASPTTTAKIYAHLIEEAESKNLEIVESMYK